MNQNWTIPIHQNRSAFLEASVHINELIEVNLCSDSPIGFKKAEMDNIYCRQTDSHHNLLLVQFGFWEVFGTLHNQTISQAHTQQYTYNSHAHSNTHLSLILFNITHAMLPFSLSLSNTYLSLSISHHTYNSPYLSPFLAQSNTSFSLHFSHTTYKLFPLTHRAMRTSLSLSISQHTYSAPSHSLPLQHTAMHTSLSLCFSHHTYNAPSLALSHTQQCTPVSLSLFIPPHLQNFPPLSLFFTCTAYTRVSLPHQHLHSSMPISSHPHIMLASNKMYFSTHKQK